MKTEVGDEIIYFGSDTKHWGEKFIVYAVVGTYVKVKTTKKTNLSPTHKNYINTTKKIVGKDVFTKINAVIDGLDALLKMGYKMDKNGRFEVPE